jgi:hypothetical protein
MMAGQTDWSSLLRNLDDPAHLETPDGYDPDETTERFEQLVARLEAQFACQCQVDRYVQDASHHGEIIIPADHTSSGQHIHIRISHFGNLAVYSPGNLGSYTDCEKHDLLPSEDRHRI